MTLLWWTLTAEAACPATNAKLTEELDRAEGAFAALDVAAFEAARTELTTLTACLGEAPPGALVARIHGVNAIAAVVAKDDAAATRSLQAARAADPAWNLPPAVPEGHRLRGMLDTLPPPGDGGMPLIAPTGTHTVVDGHDTEMRPLDRPSLVWLRQDDGYLPWSSLLLPGAPNPDVSRFAVVAPPPPVVPPEPRRRASLRTPLAIATGVAVIGSGLLYGGASMAASRFDDPRTPYPELDGYRSRANGLTIASVIGLGAAVGLGAATFAAPEAP